MSKREAMKLAKVAVKEVGIPASLDHHQGYGERAIRIYGTDSAGARKIGHAIAESLGVPQNFREATGFAAVWY